MHLSRVLPLVVLPVLALTACGSQDAPVPSADDALTAACRGYVLSVGDSDLAKAKELIASVPYATDGDDPVLEGVRAAAAEGGRSPGLATADFERFRALVAGIDAMGASTSVDAEGNQTIGIKQVLAFQRAAETVHKRCSASR